IAWQDYSGGDWEIYYAYWNGSSWVTHGGVNTGGGLSNNANDSALPSLALDSSGNPHIAWQDYSGGDWEIYYAYWDGDSWETYGGANTGGGVSNNVNNSWSPSLALDSSDNPHIAWEDISGGDAEIYYAYWNGSNWVTYDGANTGGGVSNNANDSVIPFLSLDSSGNPHIVWHDWSDQSGDSEIYYRYWNPAGGTTTTTTTTSTTTTTFLCQWCPADIPWYVPGCLSGRVTNHTGEPLAGKTVILRGGLPGNTKEKRKTQTDDNGCYHFGGLDGIYKIWVKRCKGERRRTIGVPLGKSVNDVNFECR
ncbi:MAG TPA: hypothetical protein ACFYD6_13370, partial [Candidatus Brocadiia bacterium]